MSTSTISKLRETEGFTLIELLIVVVIIGILAAIAIPQFSSTKEKAFDAAAKSDVRNMQTAQESYFADNQEYTAVSLAGSPDGATTDLDGDGADDYQASPQVSVTVTTATNGYTAQAAHSNSSNCWEVDTTPSGNSSIHTASC